MDKVVKEFEGVGWNRAGAVALAVACQAALRVRHFNAKSATSLSYHRFAGKFPYLCAEDKI
jgi:hypothetical protein